MQRRCRHLDERQLEEGFSKVIKGAFLHENLIQNANVQLLPERWAGLRLGLSIWPPPPGIHQGLWAEPGAPQRPVQKPRSQPRTFRLEMGKLRPEGGVSVVELEVAPGLLNICLRVQSPFLLHCTPGKAIIRVQAVPRGAGRLRGDTVTDSSGFLGLSVVICHGVHCKRWCP